MAEVTQAQKAFVVKQHELYGALTERVRTLRDALDADADLPDVLDAETRLILDSPMTREQIASALVSVMVRVAQGEDLLAPSAGGVVPLHLSGALPIQAVRGGIRFPAPDQDAIQAAWEASNG